MKNYKNKSKNLRNRTLDSEWNWRRTNQRDTTQKDAKIFQKLMFASMKGANENIRPRSP